jgi:hypothetical protein
MEIDSYHDLMLIKQRLCHSFFILLSIIKTIIYAIAGKKETSMIFHFFGKMYFYFQYYGIKRQVIRNSGI